MLTTSYDVFCVKADAYVLAVSDWKNPPPKNEKIAELFEVR